jgi:hypothetical protein
MKAFQQFWPVKSLTPYNKLRISLPGVGEQDRSGQVFPEAQQHSRNSILMTEVPGNLHLLPVDSLPDNGSTQPFILKSLYWQYFLQLIEQSHVYPLSSEKLDKVVADKSKMFAQCSGERFVECPMSDANARPAFSPQLHGVILDTTSPYLRHSATVNQDKELTALRIQLVMALEDKRERQLLHYKLQSELQQLKIQLSDLLKSSDAYRQQSSEKLSLLSTERFELECLLQERLNGDKGIEQQQITSLQQLLMEARETQKRAQTVFRERELELQVELNEVRACLAQVQEERQQRESTLQATLDERNRSARENLARTEAEFTQKIESLIERNERLEAKLATKEQASKDAEIEHKKAQALLRFELDQARDDINRLSHSRRKLEESLRRTKAESLTQAEQYNKNLKIEKQQASEERSRFNKLIEGLNEELDEKLAKVHQLRKKLFKLKVLLEQKHRKAVHLLQLLKAKEEDSEGLKQQLADLELHRQELETELIQLINDKDLAWEKVSESDLAMQLVRQDLTSIKLELEQENATLRAELDYQKESRELIQEKYSEEVEKLQKSLADYQAEQKIADSSICSLKKEQQSLIEAKSEFNRQITHLKAESRKRQSELSATIDSGQHEILLLRKKLESAIALKTDQAVLKNTQQTLRQVEGENASLKQKIEKMQQTLEARLRKNKQKRIKRSQYCTVRKGEQIKTWRSSDTALPLRRQKQNSTSVRGRLGKLRTRI